MFAVAFTIFIAATLVLIVLTMRWAIRRDRQGRQERSGDKPL